MDNEAKPKNLNAGHRARLLDRYMKNGIEALAEHEILELLLHYAIPQRDTKTQAKTLIEAFGGFGNLFKMGYQDIADANVSYVKERAAALITLTYDIGEYIKRLEQEEVRYIKTSEEAGEYAVALLKKALVEKFYIVNLDAKHKVISCDFIREGISDITAPKMQRIMKTVLIHNDVSNVIFMHNHPNGVLNPSREDVDNTAVLSARLSECGIKLADHIIVAGDRFLSMKNRGFMT